LAAARTNALQAKTSPERMPMPRFLALAACQDFLTLSKDPDPEIPIWKQAKAECAKLQ
jgi:hypothetical protein